uniref:Reverse transcriptase domain-containing protein n=1 Tax=Gouania willdenowi TaxID=441366 RepID=A0A8C5FXS9_GOUWI
MAADSGKCSVLVLLVLSSAFDTDVVVMSGPVLEWFRSYLTGRMFPVSSNIMMSQTADLKWGVPQGLVPGPLLFLIYLLPLGELIQQFSEVSYHLYAEDLQLYCSFKSSEPQRLASLTNCLVKIKQWLSENSLQLNSCKTEGMFLEREKRCLNEELYICPPSYREWECPWRMKSSLQPIRASRIEKVLLRATGSVYPIVRHLIKYYKIEPL